MTASNYIVMCNQCMIDEICNEHHHTINAMNSEYIFITEALEKNYISLEAASANANKQEGIFARIINAIKSLFAKFLKKVKDILVPLDKWNKKMLPKLDDIDFNGLEIQVLPYWKADDDLPITKINSMISAFSAVQDREGTKYPTTNEEAAAFAPAFKEFYNKDIGFSQVCKTRFSFDKFITPDKASGFGGVKLSAPNEIKSMCESMRRYLLGYKEYSNKLIALSNKFKSELEKAEQAYKTAAARESAKESVGMYLALEETYIANTELRFCRNYSALFEETKVENDSDKKATTTVTTTDDSSDKSTASTGGDSTTVEKKESADYLKYKKILASLIMNAIAAAITVAELKVIAYKDAITKIINAKAKNQPKDKEEADVKTTKK